MMPGVRLGTLVAMAITWSVISACDKHTTPTTPTVSPTVQPQPNPSPNPTGLSVSGVVAASGGGPIAGARIDITAGANSGQGTSSDLAGRYALSNLTAGKLTLKITAAAFVVQTVDLSLAASQVADVSLTPVPFQSRGRVFDAYTSASLAGITMSGGALSAAPSSGAGMLIAFADSDSSDPRSVVLEGPGVIQRRTTVRVPGPDFALSLIASNFDLTAFDQMVRTPMLCRWTTPPPLIVQRQTLQFTSADAFTAVATDDAMTTAEAASIEVDLQAALSPMTGGAFGSFDSIQEQTATAGDMVGILNTGSITVMRMAGLQAATGFLGFGRFQVQSDGTVIGGMMMLDRDFDRSGGPSVRTLRAHELGHGLGYNHVTARTSVMSPEARTWPTSWDIDAFRIAFDRMPGNRSPDIDASTGQSAVAGGATWSRPIK
jgi:hypothetical protein